jgi:hypothetical protein
MPRTSFLQGPAIALVGCESWAYLLGRERHYRIVQGEQVSESETSCTREIREQGGCPTSQRAEAGYRGTNLLMQKSPTKPEFDLLLACCTTKADSGRSSRIGLLLDRGPDWVEFVRLTKHHGTGPLVYRSLSAFTHATPSPVLEQLRRDYERNAQKSVWLTHELIRILDCLESRGIPAIPYKGPVLAKTIYGDIAWRRFSDLDILIRATDVWGAKAAVHELGYTPTLDMNEAELGAHVASGHEWSFDGPLGSNLLEIQWRVLPRFYAVEFSIDNFFQRASRVDLGGRSVRTLAPEDLLLVLCAHTAKHVWSRLSWLCDIAETMRSQPIDYISAYRTAEGLGIEKIVAVNFLLQNQLLGVPVPVRFRKNDPEIECLAKTARQVLIGGSEYDAPSIDYFRLMVRLRERFQDKFRFLVRLIFTPSVGEWSTVRLPVCLFPLYRGIRVFRLMARFLAGTVNRRSNLFRGQSELGTAAVTLEESQ